MLPPAESPVHSLVSTWFNQPPPLATTPFRIKLFTAATEEILRSQAQGRVYDPLSDNRFRWAAQWLDLGDRCIERIDSDLAILAGFILNPPRQAHDFLPA